MAEYQLTSFLGRKVQLDRGGPESKTGIIVAIGTDYLVLSTTVEGYLYYYIDHIKSITLTNGDNNLHDDLVTEFQENNPLPETLKEIITEKKYKLMQINRGGPEKVRGILTEIYDDYVAIVAKEEVVLVVYSHIKNVSFPAPLNTEENVDQAKDENKEKSSSSTKKRTRR